MNRYDTYLLALRYSILVGALAGALLTIPPGGRAIFVLAALMLVLNTQLRLIFNKNRPYLIISILIDLGFAFYMSRAFSAFAVLLLLATLEDVLLELEAEAYPLFCVISPAYAWCVLSELSLESGLVYLVAYLAVALLFAHIRKELSARSNTESLYDRLRNSNYELEAAQARLVEYSKQVEANTKLEERNRISRELHDSIGHRLTGILMQVDAAIQLTEAGNKKGMNILRAAYGNINESIEAVRDTVRKLNPSGHISGKTSVRELAARFRETSGIAVEYVTSGVPYELLPSVETVLFRNLQEAFTNSVRHGQATCIRVELIYRPGLLEAVVSDNGTGCGEIVKGFGLRGMEERLEIVGGGIEYDGSGGFTVRMRLPVKEV